MTVLRSAAMTCGRLPERTCEASSPKDTTQTQWERFSMCQCWRNTRSNWAAVICVGRRLVTPYTVSRRTSPVRLVTTRRTTRRTCCAPSQSR
jgi:hypothetical protein